MEKTRENVQMLTENTLRNEEGCENFPVERFVTAYLEGQKFVPENDTEDQLAGYVEGTLWTMFERYKPEAFEEWKHNAEKIPVIINGKTFQTFIDERGVQRFVGNAVMRRILDSLDSHRVMNLNTLSIDHQSGMFSNDEWLEFYTSFNYSVSGFMGLSDFCNFSIENPLWDEEE